MGIFSISRLKQGKETFISLKKNVFSTVNLMDARQELNISDYSLVLEIFSEISKNEEGILFRSSIEYNKFILNEVISLIDIVVLYYKISGSGTFERACWLWWGTQKKELVERKPNCI